MGEIQDTKIFFQENAFNMLLRKFCSGLNVLSNIHTCPIANLPQATPYHPDGHHWDYYPGDLSFSQVIATHLMIGHP